MPIVLSAVGSTLDATIIDANFGTIEDLLKEGIVTADFLDKFTHYQIRRFAAGRIVSFSLGTNPYMPADLLTRLGVFESNFRGRGDAPKNQAEYELVCKDNRHKEVTELLGRPGPSFSFDWQEDGFTDPTTHGAAAGWPPSWWPNYRHPDTECHSYWLTVPHAAGRIYVAEPCVAKVVGHAKGALAFSTIRCKDGARPTVDNLLKGQYTDGVFRFGTFVDTNPHVFADEFANVNPNINGNYCSFKKLEDKSFRGQWMNEVRVPGHTALVGGRSYNFALKHRRANTVGHTYRGGGAPFTFRDTDWEFDGDTNFNQTIDTTPPWKFWTNGISPHTVMWESTSLYVEFFYGRDEAWVNDYTDGEFSAVP